MYLQQHATHFDNAFRSWQGLANGIQSSSMIHQEQWQINMQGNNDQQGLPEILQDRVAFLVW